MPPPPERGERPAETGRPQRTCSATTPNVATVSDQRQRITDWPTPPFRAEQLQEPDNELAAEGLTPEHLIRLENSAFADFCNIVGSLEVVGRVMWPGCADLWTRDVLRRCYKLMLVDDSARCLGDMLLRESGLVKDRLRATA